MKHVVFFSGGIASWAAAKRVAVQYGTENLILFFSDTKTEDGDLYRFLYEAATNVGGELLIDCDGRGVWEVFRDCRFLGNSRIDPCSRVLKRDRAHRWVEKTCDPCDTTLYLGIDWSESHRKKSIVTAWDGYHVEFPLCNPPLLTKEGMFKLLEQEGIQPPRLYTLGFPHNNCGGFCVKAGQAQFRHLLKTLPDRYLYHEQKEQKLREFLGKDVTVLRQQRNGVKHNVTLREFREQQEATYKSCEEDEWGGCGCFLEAFPAITSVANLTLSASIPSVIPTGVL